MTTLRKRHGISFECDGCEDQFDTELNDFRDALDMAKHNDWAVRNIDGTWCHVCPDCQKAELV